MIDATEKKWILVDSETGERVAGSKVFTSLTEAEDKKGKLNESSNNKGSITIKELLMG